MAKTKRINKINVICNSVMAITPILPQTAGKRGSRTACRCLLQAPSYESITYTLKLCYIFLFSLNYFPFNSPHKKGQLNAVLLFFHWHGFALLKQVEIFFFYRPSHYLLYGAGVDVYLQAVFVEEGFFCACAVGFVVY
jgi:hypothetical protein